MEFNNQKSNQIFSDNLPVFSQPTEKINLPPESLRPNLPQPQKSHKRLFIFVGIFLGLAVILGGGYFAWQRGYISLPFLTPKIDEVIAASIDKLKALDQYSYGASLKFLAEDRDSEIVPIAISSDNNFSKYLEGNIKNEIDQLMNIEGVYKSRGNGKGDIELRYYGHSNYTDLETPFEINLKVIDDEIYMKINDVIKGLASISEDWMKIAVNSDIESFFGPNTLFPGQILEQMGQESRQLTDQISDIVSQAGRCGLISIKNGPKETINGFQTQEVTLNLDLTRFKKCYKEVTDMLDTKYGDKAVYKFDQEVYQKFDEPDNIEIMRYISENLDIHFWYDIDSGIPIKLYVGIVLVPPQEILQETNKQITIELTSQLTAVNEEVTIEKPTNFIDLEDLERGLMGINEEEQEVHDQSDRVTDLRDNLLCYNKLFEHYPANWDELKNVKVEDIDAAIEEGKSKNTTNIPSYNPNEFSGEQLKKVVGEIVTTDYFTGEDYPYKVTDDGYEFTYQIPLNEKVTEKNKTEMPFSFYVDGINTTNKDHISVEEYMKNEAGLDWDEDGLTNVEEEELGTNDAMIDTDDDGLSDFEEVKIYNTDPLKEDTDGDIYNDKIEVEGGYNPNGPGKLNMETICGDVFEPSCKAVGQTVSCGVNQQDNYLIRKDASMEESGESYFDWAHDADWRDIHFEEAIGGTNREDNACCYNPYDCVFNGVCYQSCDSLRTSGCQLVDVDEDGVAGEFCSSYSSRYTEGVEIRTWGWQDCDSNELICRDKTFCNFSNAWVDSGESTAHGEYGEDDLNSEEKTECCGDDINEYLITKDGISKCCDAATDTLDADGNCISQ